jgi:hypothetical protein
MTAFQNLDTHVLSWSLMMEVGAPKIANQPVKIHCVFLKGGNEPCETQKPTRTGHEHVIMTQGFQRANEINGYVLEGDPGEFRSKHLAVLRGCWGFSALTNSARSYKFV